MKVAIKGMGFYVPEEVVTNFDLEKILDTSDAWIVERTGIRERRRAKDTELTSDLAVNASKMAIKNAGIDPTDIDFIICATASPDYLFPSTGCIVGTKLGLGGVPAVDIAAGCTGFIYALSIAHGLLATGNLKNVLVVGAEELFKIVDPEDRSTYVLFGDGAGAAILGLSEDDSGILGWELRADGGYGELLMLPARGVALPLNQETIEKKLHYVKMKGNEIFKLAVRCMGDVSLSLLKKLGMNSSQLDWIVPHQANIRIIQALAKRLDVPMERVIVNVDKYGNTSAASIPIAICEAIEEGKIKKGDVVLLVAFGAGLTWGAMVLRI
ncbi:MAG: beta-ketoacyl-ACP synthase III [Thermosulfidibacteraceae bacterium]|jgi:3-oxoacyl-[acyl-carrier-protein] synthase-3